MRTAVPIGNPIVSGEVSGWLVPDTPSEVPTWGMHHAFEMTLLLEGEHERWYEDGTILGMEPGDVSLHGAWEPHGHRSTTKTVLLVLFFYADMMGQSTLCGVPWLKAFTAPPADRPRAVTPEARAQVLAIAAELRQEVERQPPDLPTALHLGILRLLFVLLRQWHPAEVAAVTSRRHTSDLAAIAPALHLLYANLTARRITVEEGAAACCLSLSRFAALFRRTMGVSFGQFVLHSRLARAARMLLESTDSVDAVATSLGFSDVSHFHHAFVKHYACTPAQYRQRAAASSA